MNDYFILNNDNQNYKEIEVMRGILLQIYLGENHSFYRISCNGVSNKFSKKMGELPILKVTQNEVCVFFILKFDFLIF